MAQETITVKCPRCSSEVKLDRSAIRTATFTCPACGEGEIPAPAEQPEAAFKIVDAVYCPCGHVDILVQEGFLSKGDLLAKGNGKLRPAVVLYRIKVGRNDKRILTTNWMEVKHCPICGLALPELTAEAA